MRKLFVAMILIGTSLAIFGFMSGQQPAHNDFRPVQQHGDDCLAASSVTLLRYYGVYVSQVKFADEDPGASVGHAAVLINGYLRGSGIRVAPFDAMTTDQLAWTIRHSGGPVLATLWTSALPWWKGYWPGAHEILIERATGSTARVWDPGFGQWHTVALQAIASSAWEYLVVTSW